MSYNMPMDWVKEHAGAIVPIVLFLSIGAVLSIIDYWANRRKR